MTFATPSNRQPDDKEMTKNRVVTPALRRRRCRSGNRASPQLLDQRGAVEAKQAGRPVFVATGALQSLTDEPIFELPQQEAQVQPLWRQIDERRAQGANVGFHAGRQVAHGHTSVLGFGENHSELFCRQSGRDHAKAKSLGGQGFNRLRGGCSRNTIVSERGRKPLKGITSWLVCFDDENTNGHV